MDTEISLEEVFRKDNVDVYREYSYLEIIGILLRALKLTYDHYKDN